MIKFVLATANKDKAAEIRQILGGIDLVERPADVPDVDETGETLVANARLKAVALCEATGMAAIADDTGLEVDALDGAPGVYSARYAGEHVTYEDNRLKLLAALDGAASRAARFKTVAIVRYPDGNELIAEGIVEGVITSEQRGSGWGYDPVFEPAESSGLTFAEMPMESKNAISHRGRAFRALAELIGSETI